MTETMCDAYYKFFKSANKKSAFKEKRGILFLYTQYGPYIFSTHNKGCEKCNASLTDVAFGMPYSGSIIPMHEGTHNPYIIHCAACASKLYLAYFGFKKRAQVAK